MIGCDTAQTLVRGDLMCTDWVKIKDLQYDVAALPDTADQ